MDQIAFLNETLAARGKLNSVLLNLVFLRQCMSSGVVPKRIQARVKRAKVYHSLKIENAFLRDEIDRCQHCLEGWRRKFLQRLRHAKTFLSVCDFIRFGRLISECDVKQGNRGTELNQRNLGLLKKNRYGSFCVSHETIINLSDVELTSIQKDILCRGPHMGVPQRTKSEEVLCEFEMFYRQLLEFTPATRTAATQCRASLEALAHEYANKENDLKAFSLGREHLKVLNDLRKNEKLVITRPDKGRATVVMNREDYVSKMMTILSDTSKFCRLGPVSTHDKTPKVEAALNRLLGDIMASGEIMEELFKSIRSTGALRPRMYGLPKIHKDGVPLRPILSMTRSPQYDVSKWLCRVLNPVLQMYSTRSIKDSFSFIDLIKGNKICSDGHMCSFDAVSLFTNVPLEKTIDICADALYRSDDAEPMTISEDSFRKLLRMVTSGVEFSFDGIMYRQIDGVAMGSPLGPVLANIFVGFCESSIPDADWPPLYCRFVDDSFAYFDKREDSDRMMQILNDLHPSLKFTCEHEVDGRLPFLDVLVEKTIEDGVLTSVYRKPTFTGLYITWDSYCATKYKVNLVRNLVNRAHRICSKQKVDQELDKLKSIFMNNGYPVDLLNSLIRPPKTGVSDCLRYGPKPCPVFIRLPWKGHWSSSIARTITSVTRSAYYAVNATVMYSTARAFNLKKDILPSHEQSNLVYEFECRTCGGRYVGRTLQRLNTRIRQHVPLHLLSSGARAQRPTRGRPRKNPGTLANECPDSERRVCPPRRCKGHCDGDNSVGAGSRQKNSANAASADYQSSVAKHLVDNHQCAVNYDDSCFRVVCVSSSKSRLEVLEALFIRSLTPDLCSQKNNVAVLKLFRADCNTA